MKTEVKPLYRKMNTRVRHGSHHFIQKDAKYDRNTKKGIKKSMSSHKSTGLDYTPLMMYLISSVGKDWNEVYNYAIKRLDSEEPIYWIVAKSDLDKKNYIRTGQSFYNGLYVDENNILQKVNPNLNNEDLKPDCPCCTHTFNGKPFINEYHQETTSSNYLNFKA